MLRTADEPAAYVGQVTGASPDGTSLTVDRDAANATGKPAAEPPDQPDELTFQQQADLTPTQRAAYSERLLIAELRKQIRDLQAGARSTEAELIRLRIIERTHDKLVYARAWQVWVNGVSAVAVVVGGGLISSYAKDAGSAFYGLGWGLVLLGAVLIAGQALVRAAVGEKRREAGPPPK